MTNPENTTDRSDIQQVLVEVRELRQKVDHLGQEVERFNDRFSAYQQGTQWVVQLAFTLLASATITVIITSVLRR